MKFRATLTCLLALLFALPASAAPTKLAQQGRVLDGDGAPLEGTHAMVFVLYDADTDGTTLWTEERDADFAAGYYSITLGEQVPLDDLLFTAESVWLELSIDGETLSPRQEVVSVPYALRATAAEHVEGGMVDAAEISIDGTVVIDASGNWVGPTPSVGWSDLADIPADIADGDQDEDTLAGLVCAEGQLPKWDAANGMWVCGDDTDTTDPNTDTLLTLVCTAGQVAKWNGATWACGDDIDTTDPNTDVLAGLPCADGFIAKYDGASGLWDCALDADSFADLAGVCLPGDIPVLDPVSGGWACGADTNTQLTEAQVDAMVDNNGYSTGAHTTDTNTQLNEAQVDAMVDNNGYSTGAHTTDTNTDTLADLTCTDAQTPSYQASSTSWVCVSPSAVFDADNDGVFAWLDCDDTDSTSTTIAADGDCDGALTAADCDDGDANSTILATDGDCDGIVTAADCDDTDPDVTDFDGQSSDCPGLSCLELLDGGYSVGDGTYWLDPTGLAPFEATCDMTTEGGGYDYVAVESGLETSKFSDPNDCPAGTDIVYPRSEDHWTSMFARFDSSYFYTVPGVYRTSVSNSGDYTNCVMNSTGCSDWRVGDGGRWWLRATVYSEPSGDYTPGCWLHMSSHAVTGFQFNDYNCQPSTTKYICSTNDKP